MEIQPFHKPLTPEGFRQSVAALQEQMLAMPQVECPVTHHFAPSVYARECFIPAGSLVIGKIHRRECLNILLKGEITVITEEGQKRLSAPCTFVAPAYTKKAAYAHTDVIWTNIIPTDETDPDKIEEEHICPSFDEPEFLEFVQKNLLIEG